MTDVVNPKSASPDQLLPYHKKISAEGKALMKCFISYTYMVLKNRNIKTALVVQKLLILFTEVFAGSFFTFQENMIS